MSAEAMMDTIIKEVQGALNGLQVALRNLCALEDQEVDENDDFKEAVALEDATVNLTDNIPLKISNLRLLGIGARSVNLLWSGRRKPLPNYGPQDYGREHQGESTCV